MAEKELRYWANQHGAGVTVSEDLYLRFQIAAYLTGFESVEEWFNDVIVKACNEALEPVDTEIARYAENAVHMRGIEDVPLPEFKEPES